MRNPEIDRLEAKLKLWDTPGFSQFLQDLIDYTGFPCPVANNVEAIRRHYQARLKGLKTQQEGKFKQGELEL